jgi:chemotaxis protein CheC
MPQQRLAKYASSSMNDLQLTGRQLRRLESAFHAGADEASTAMASWLGVPSLIVVESLDQAPLQAAGNLLGDPEATLCACSMRLSGSMSGQLVFAFEDGCGLSLADLLLDRPPGASAAWGVVEESAALESANIIGCAYLNAFARTLSAEGPAVHELIPSPPLFQRDFAGSLLQSLIMNQAMETNTVFLARTRFEIRGQPLNWTLLLIPDAASLVRFREALIDD